MTRTSSRLRRGLATTAALTLLAVTVAGCAGGSGDESGGGGAEPASATAEGAQDGAARRSAVSNTDAQAFDSDLAAEAAGTAFAEEDERALISQGNVQLRSDDVADARFKVQNIVDALAGEISQEETATDDEGEVRTSRLVLRIPSSEYATAMSQLEEAAELVVSSSNVEDVTTKVIDNAIRLRIQRRSIERIELLLDRAQSIRDIVSIEAQLSRRQADLGSLERQQEYLADQTSMATIIVSLERTKAPATDKEKDERGFVAGLDKGWTEFKEAAVAIATGTGAALPFLILLLVVAVPTWILLRRLGRRHATAAPATAEA